MIIGKITSKSQTTVPKSVRLALGLQPGDGVAWEIDGDAVRVLRVAPNAPDMFVGNFATFSEWDSAADREAFANL